MRVRVSDVAESDIWRLSDFLYEKSPHAANAAVDVILEGMASLSDLAERGNPMEDDLMRELHLPFGHGAYIVQYRVLDDEVTILRIFHSLEDR